MELLHGRILGAVLAEAGRLSEARAARLVIQLCGALQVAHERGVVHRDIKPDNVMVIEDEQLGERIKLLDFGIAKGLGKGDRVEDSLNSGCETRYGALIGTPEYMAPEQCMGRDVDERTDVYACGVLLYRMLTGRVPFDGTGAHPFELCQRHIGEEPAPPRALAPWIRPEMEAVVLKALRKAPEERHQSAAELSAELTAVLASIDRMAVELTVPVLVEDVVRSEQVAALAADLAAPVTIVEVDNAPTLPRLSADMDSLPTLVNENPDDSDREPYFVPLRLDDSGLPKLLDAPLIVPAPAPDADRDRTTAIPAAPQHRQGRVSRYLPTMAVAAVVGAGLGSIFMALVPLLHH
jgi:serine/threonine-protein kinase